MKFQRPRLHSQRIIMSTKGLACVGEVIHGGAGMRMVGRHLRLLLSPVSLDKLKLSQLFIARWRSSRIARHKLIHAARHVFSRELQTEENRATKGDSWYIKLVVNGNHGVIALSVQERCGNLSEAR